MEDTVLFQSSQNSRMARWASRAGVVLLLLVVMALPTEGVATNFTINNSALALGTVGGIRFDHDVGNEFALKALQNAKDFILLSFNRSQEIPVELLSLSVENMSGVAYTLRSPLRSRTLQTQMRLSAIYVGNFAPGDAAALQNEITGVLTHEATHAWQNSNGSYATDRVFAGVVEGIADFIRLRAQFPSPRWMRQPGGNWYDGYTTTAFFLDWIDSTQFLGFVNELNWKMASRWNVSFFEDITGKTVDGLWTEYQAFLFSGPPLLTTFRINNMALNMSGGARFEQELGHEAMLQVLVNAKAFIQASLNKSVEKVYTLITLFVDHVPGAIATAGGNGRFFEAEIHLSADYVGDYAPGNASALVYEITGVLIHESTHIWQNSNGTLGSDLIFTGMIEGIADFMRLRAGFPKAQWVRQAGGKWYDGQSTTAYFLDWIDNTQFKGFVNELNLKMERAWNDSFFSEIIPGKTVDALWEMYQVTLS